MQIQGGDKSNPGVIFDCQVYVQALLGKGPSFACLELAEAGAIKLFTSSQIIDEVSRVLHRPFVREKRPEITVDLIEAFLRRVAVCSTMVDPVPDIFTYQRDPKDEPYLNLAIHMQVEFLVSRDKDLLDLTGESNEDGIHVRKLAPKLAILEPVTFLRLHAAVMVEREVT